MQSYCIRVDKLNEGDDAKLSEWLLKQGTAIGCYEWHNGNHHFHIWLHSSKKIEAIRANFKLKFPSHKGNGSYSIKSDDGNLSYICKGPEAPDKRSDPVIFVNTSGVNQSQIDEAHESYWKSLDNLKKKIKNKKEVVESNFQKALQYCKEHEVTASSDGWKIVMVLINYYRENVKCEPNDFQLRLMAKSIQVHLCYERAKAENKMHIYENLLKERARQIIGSEWIHPSF